MCFSGCCMLQNVVNAWDIESIYFDCSLYLFTMLLVVTTLYQIRSAFILSLIVTFPAAFRVIFWKLFRVASDSKLIAMFFAGFAFFP